RAAGESIHPFLSQHQHRCDAVDILNLNLSEICGDTLEIALQYTLVQIQRPGRAEQEKIILVQCPHHGVWESSSECCDDTAQIIDRHVVTVNPLAKIALGTKSRSGFDEKLMGEE